jgi:hypothetical protein
MAMATLMPKHDLVQEIKNPPKDLKNPAKTRFILMGEEWLTVQTYVTQALQLPINTANWNERYGDFPAADKNLVTNALGAMKDVQSLGTRFGNPTTLKKHIIETPDYTMRKTPPDEIYGHIVWLASQIYAKAGTFTGTFKSFKSLLDPTGQSEQERAANLRSVLVGRGGLVSDAKDMADKTAELLKKMAKFDTDLTAANGTIVKYSGQSSQLLASARTIIGQDEDLIKKTQELADAAYRKWRDYMISAIAVSVGLFVLSMGLLVLPAAIAGAVLGTLSAKARAQYNEYLKEIGKKQENIRKKNLLVYDLGSLNTSALNVSGGIGKFLATFQQIEGTFLDMAGNLSYIANNYTDKQLADMNVVNQALRLDDATKKWHKIGESAQEFTRNSLVDFQVRAPHEPVPTAA